MSQVAEQPVADDGEPVQDAAARAQARQRAHHVDSVEEARVCAADGCTTKLSRYNLKPRCALHD
jgi:hypothetical protein